jgi:hypothetical protein
MIYRISGWNMIGLQTGKVQQQGYKVDHESGYR